MKFSAALDAVLDGGRAQRSFWNGRGMFIFVNLGAIDHTSDKLSISGVGREFFEDFDAGIITRMPNINLRAADGTIATGWAPTQADMFADDWRIVE